MTTLIGRIARTFFSGNGWMAGVLTDDTGTDHKFAGPVIAVVGDTVKCEGGWIQHPKFGRQFEIKSATVQMDATPTGIARLLASDKRFEGIGEKRAGYIVDAAIALASDGEPMTGMREHTVEVAERAGVPVKVVTTAVEVWRENSERYAGLAALAEQGWTTGQAEKIVDVFGEGAASIVRSDPYALIRKIERFGFRTIDAIAQKMGIHSADPRRLRAGVMFCVEREADSGSTWTTREALTAATVAELEPDSLDAEMAIDEMIDELVEGGALREMTEPHGETIIASTSLARAELEVFEWLTAALTDKTQPLDVTGERAVAAAERLNDGQREVMAAFTSRRAAVMSGAAGVGKTYTIEAICEVAEENGLRIKTCAPTGKAAKQIQRATGRPAQTIHRLLEPIFAARGFEFTRNAGNPIDADLVVVDEASMIDVRLMRSLIEALPSRCRVLLVGDHNQIPSVGPGAILRDLLSARTDPEYADAIHVLTQIHRQAGDLARNTSAILDGVVVHQDSPAWGIVNVERGHEAGVAGMVADIVESLVTDPGASAFFGRQLGLDFDVQVLAPMRKGPVGTWALNAAIQRLRARLLGGSPPEPWAGDKAPKPVIGDRVVWTKNDYELNLMNGTLAIVKEFRKGGDMLIETEDGRTVEVDSGKRQNIEVAYALTIHRFQGSQAQAVVLALSSKHYIMADRNLFYTGASRASKSLTIVGDPVGLRTFAQSERSKKRSTLGAFFMAPGGWLPEAATSAPHHEAIAGSDSL